MRLRWITILCALALQVALFAALLPLGRMLLNRNYAALEREHVEGDLRHVCIILQSNIRHLELMTHDFATRPATVSFLRHAPRRPYVGSELSRELFRNVNLRLYMLIDRRNRVILERSYVDDLRTTRPADVAQLLRAVKRRSRPDAPAAGLLTLTAGPAIVIIQPILQRPGSGPPLGAVVLVSNLGPAQVAELSRLSDLPVNLSGTVGESAELAGDTELTCTSLAITSADEDRLLGSATLNDLWKRPGIRLQIEHDRNIWREGRQTVHALLIALLVVGALFGFLNVWLMQRLVVRRIERLIRLTRETESEAGLQARVDISGSDEVAELGMHMNRMFERLQNSHEKLLAVQERLRYEATHDSLTGIWNRCAALHLLDQELARSLRDGSSVAILMFDADHFKRINDHFGHSTGDRALQAVAAAITRNLRPFDVCCRYGGEEFLVIAPSCPLEMAAAIADRIVAGIRQTPVNVPGHSFCVTLSAGVTAGSGSSGAEELIMTADRALYRAKSKGRDRVELEEGDPGRNVRSLRFATDRR